MENPQKIASEQEFKMAIAIKPLIEEDEDIKDLTDVIGHYGKWQKIIFAFMFFIGFPAAWNNLVLTFIAPDIDHWCARIPAYKNMSVEDWKNWTIPVVGKNGNRPEYDECRHYKWMTNSSAIVYVDHNRTVPCSSWEYDHSFYSRTIVEKWNLVCDKSWLISMSQSVYMAGILLASLLLGHISDRFGRRPVLLISFVSTFCSGIICAFSPSYIVFTVMRFIIGCGKSGLFDTCFVHLMESVGPEYRSVIGIAIEFGWATGYIMLPGIVWLIRDWFYIQLAITIPIILLGTMWWFLPESPRWLLSHGKLKEAVEVMEKAASINEVSVSDIDTCINKLATNIGVESEEVVKHKTVLDLFRTANIRWKALILCLNWFVVSFVFYGISLHTNSLGGNTFLNFFISGIVEFPAYFACIFIVKYLGRRLPLTISMVGGGLACILTIPIPDSLLWLRILFAMVGKLCVTAAYAIIYIYTTEVYPTVVRNIGLSSGSFCAGMGSVLAPFVKEIGEYTSPIVPMALFGGLSMVAGLLILRLSETNNRTLHDVIDQNDRLVIAGTSR
ncbi:organic cation transporter protein-like isoform X2 [Centruroides sculpturatus]|uniref:organic cation transporter protein-like isoform X2 n=1 Tax=Centruroides sculpturatus TaxID=218467 RepID=UPI000C6EEFEB|nr:organic cation transporter protein-like isoform X2 [Centruroides sculpturatus]